MNKEKIRTRKYEITERPYQGFICEYQVNDKNEIQINAPVTLFAPNGQKYYYGYFKDNKREEWGISYDTTCTQEGIFLNDRHYGDMIYKGSQSQLSYWQSSDGTMKKDPITTEQLTTNDGSYIKQSFSKDTKKHGGKVITRDKYGNCYSGEFENGVRHGIGAARFSDGSSYEGRWENGIFEGKGLLRFPDGTFYEGEFTNGAYHGDGYLSCADGSNYRGEWKNGKYHGKGELKDSNENVWEGEFGDGKLIKGNYLVIEEGKTQFNVYEIENGRRNRRSTRKNKDGTLIYTLEKKENSNVIVNYPDGSKYEGEWKDGVRHGKGVLKNSRGEVISEGNFTNDVYITECQARENNRGEYKNSNPELTLLDGRVVDSNENVYEGGWQNGMRNGIGVLTDKNGKLISEGKFEDNRLVTGKYRVKVKGKNEYNIIEVMHSGPTGKEYREKYDGTLIYTLEKKENSNVIVNYPDGSKYEGDWENGKREGRGVLTFTNGEYYEGGFKDDHRCYDNYWVIKDQNGQPIIHGTAPNYNEVPKIMVLKSHSGNLYQGQVRDNLPDGTGSCKYSNGNVYEGWWQNGKRNGIGVLKHQNGSIISEGKWKDDNYIGFNIGVSSVNESRENNGRNNSGSVHGVSNRNEVSNVNNFQLPNGANYTGAIKNGKREGKGMMNFVNGEQYEGDWKCDKREGKGVLKYIDGSKYEGDWKCDKREGKGVLKYNNGASYEGEFQNDMCYGKGILKYRDGSVYEGGFKNDMCDGKGILKFEGVGFYEGEFKDNKREGKGKFALLNGEFYEGEFEDGNCINGFHFVKDKDGEGYDVLEIANGQHTGKKHRKDINHNLLYTLQQTGSKTVSVTYSNGDQYKGEWDGKGPKGDGEYKVFQNKTLWAGSFKNNTLHNGSYYQYDSRNAKYTRTHEYKNGKPSVISNQPCSLSNNNSQRKSSYTDMIKYNREGQLIRG